VVPDDARELESDLIAYRRELRRDRRLKIRNRLLRPFARHGVAMPLIAAALIVALVSGILITILGPRSSPHVTRGRIADSPSAGPVGGPLPTDTVFIGDRGDRPVPLSDLRPGVILIVPAGCRCGATVTELARQALSARLKFTLAADRRDSGESSDQALQELRKIQAQSDKGVVEVADDRSSVMAGTYQASGLTAVLVRPDGIVNEVYRDLRPGAELKPSLSRLLN
jgi:hypothetical protein